MLNVPFIPLQEWSWRQNAFLHSCQCCTHTVLKLFAFFLVNWQQRAHFSPDLHNRDITSICKVCNYKVVNVALLKGHWTSITSSPNFFPKMLGFLSIGMGMTTRRDMRSRVTYFWRNMNISSRVTYFWRNMNISSIFYFSMSTSINTQLYSSLWGTLKLMLFTKYLIK